MSRKDGLRDKLQRLAADPVEAEEGWRRIGGADAVVSEIDETVLPRKLSFRNVQGAVLCLEVGHRRLRRFLPPCPEALADHMALFESARLDPATDLPAVAAVLARHFAGTGTVWARSDPLPSGAGAAQTGLSVSALKGAWEVAGTGGTAAVDPEEAVDDFLDQLARRSAAWVVLGDGAVEAQSDGAESLAAGAVALWNSVVGDAAAGGAVCCVLGRSAAAETCLVLAGDGERGIVAQVDGTTAGEIAAMWQALWSP